MKFTGFPVVLGEIIVGKSWFLKKLENLWNAGYLKLKWEISLKNRGRHLIYLFIKIFLRLNCKVRIIYLKFYNILRNYHRMNFFSNTRSLLKYLKILNICFIFIGFLIFLLKSKFSLKLGPLYNSNLNINKIIFVLIYL